MDAGDLVQGAAEDANRRPKQTLRYPHARAPDGGVAMGADPAVPGRRGRARGRRHGRAAPTQEYAARLPSREINPFFLAVKKVVAYSFLCAKRTLCRAPLPEKRCRTGHASGASEPLRHCESLRSAFYSRLRFDGVRGMESGKDNAYKYGQ